MWAELSAYVSAIDYALVRSSWGLDEVPVSYNAAPTASVPVLRCPDAEQAGGELELAMLRWWLLPHWSKTPEIKYATFNAKSEEAASKPAFRGPYRNRRCVLPVNGFYEWKSQGDGTKQPYFISRADGDLLMLAGLWDRWASENGSEVIESCTVLTAKPNAEMQPIHNRMPCIIEPEDLAAWCDPSERETQRIGSMLGPAADGVLTMHPVDRRVGNAKVHNDAGLMEPV